MRRPGGGGDNATMTSSESSMARMCAPCVAAGAKCHTATRLDVIV
jgi:hypothetical protein